MALIRSVYLPQQRRAGIVYSCGLRRCLIIFAPHTHILDRRTCTCKTPSLQLILQRSKNFTSGAAVSFTSRSPIMHDRHSPPVTQVGQATKVTKPLYHCELGHVLWNGLQDQHNFMATSSQCSDIPWTDIQPNGCFGHTEFSTVAKAVDSGGGQRAVPGTGPDPPWRQHTSAGYATASIPTEGDFSARAIRTAMNLGTGTYCWGLYQPGPPATHPEAHAVRPKAATQQTCDPASDYKCFNNSNVSIRPWSWNYRSCWHQTCPPVDTHHCVWIASITSSTHHRGQVELLQFVAASQVHQHGAICVPAAHLSSGSRLSGSLSGIKP